MITATHWTFRFQPNWLCRDWISICLLFGGFVFSAVGDARAQFPRAQFSDVESGYGRGNGAGYVCSLNGTSILEELFEQTGLQVDKAKRITPRIDSYQTIIWFPDRMMPPDANVRNRLDRWLREQPYRTLIYVGRDYDAGVSYWQNVVQQLKGEQREIAQRMLAESVTEHTSRRQEATEVSGVQWFKFDFSIPERVTRVRGAWFVGRKAPQVDLELGAVRLMPSTALGRNGKILLETENGVPLVYSTDNYSSNNSRVIVVTNGSFLLNYPLTNPGNQVLASYLVREASAYGDVLFLQSGPEDIPVSNSEIGDNEQWAWIGQPPLRYLVPQFLVLGVLFCFAYYPILGRPRLAARDERISFGKHVEAVAASLRNSNDTSDALRTLNRYRELEHGGGRRPKPTE